MALLTDLFYIKSNENDNIIYISGAPATALNPIYVYNYRTDTTYTITSDAEVTFTADFGDKLEIYSDISSLYGMSITAEKYFMIGGDIMSLTNYSNIMSLANLSTFNDSDVAFTPDSNQNFSELFKNASTLIDARDLLLPANTLKNSCYKEMFAGCINLVNGPTVLPATTLAESCYESMFDGCYNLVALPTCNALTTKRRCFKNMFLGCSKITNVMQFLNTFTFYIEANSEHTELIGEEMMGMYKNCTLLTSPYTNMDFGFTISCFESMFEGCTSLTTACTFNNTLYTSGENSLGTLKTNCCKRMYANTAIQTPLFPDTIPAAIELYDNSGVSVRRKSAYHYNEMYDNCKSIITVTLTNIDAGEFMYNYTFSNCTNINTVNISFSSIDNYSAHYMFNRCTSLTSITLNIAGITLWTENSVTKYAYSCCSHMFCECTGLTAVNNTITFGEGIYLTQGFCEYMFYNCSSLNTIGITLPFFGNTDNDPTTDNRGEYACQNMFQRCSSLNNINSIYIDGWLPSYALLDMFKECTNLLNINYINKELYINGEGVCRSMFMGCTRLTDVSKLYIKGNLGKACCLEMFKNCTNLTTPPKDYFNRNIYPESCYYGMFSGCINLTSIDNIKTISDDNGNIQFMRNCFAYMFYDCRLLAVDWNGIKGKFSNGSCLYMFSRSGINSFGNIVVLPPTQNNDMLLTFSHMFDGCINLNVKSTAEEDIQYIKLDEAGISATFGESCFESMFSGCTSLLYMPIIYTGTAETNISTTRKFNKKCFKLAFRGCTQLNGNTKTFKINGTAYTSDTIYANTFEEECFYDMFNGCLNFDGNSAFNIIGINNDDNTSTIGTRGCYHMFINSGIKILPCIKADTLKSYALASAFVNCSKLDTLSENSGITATNTEAYAMYLTFKGNTTLTEMPSLYITNYGPHACEEMFMNTKITTLGTSMINARVVSAYSFYSMFENCTSLTSLADCILPGAYANYQLITQSDLESPDNIYDYPKYSYMVNSIRYNYFYGPIPGESGISYYYILKEITVDGQKIIPSKMALSDYTFARMFYGCSNLTAPPPKMNNFFYGAYSCFLMFANSGLIYTPELTALKYTEAELPRLEDDNNWYVKVSNNAPMSGSGISATTPDGKIIYKQTGEPIIEELPEGAFCGMFMNTKITTLPSIYAKKIGKNGCNSMFRDCKYLTEITYINFNINSGDAYAFSHMFNNCRNLKFAASLGANETTLFSNLRELKKYACCGMFANCNSLQKIIKFNTLTSIAEGTFASMYLNCGGLSGAVKYDFSTISIGKASFTNMFRNCENIISCDLKFGTLLRSCCENMFMACYSLTTAKVEFNDQVVSSYALTHMFYNCTALSNVWCNMRIAFSFELTHEWLLKVAPTGIYHHSSLINQNLIVRDSSSVPEGWTCTIGYEMGGE